MTADPNAELDSLYVSLQSCILDHQNPVTGLLSTPSDRGHALIRDNVYSISALWSLSIAFRKSSNGDDGKCAVKAKHLEQATVKCMRGLLTAFMAQRDRLERFKLSSLPSDSVHAKFSAESGSSVVGDHEWGHLQFDGISLYILTLAQMTAGGLSIVFTLDEVALVQNLVFMIMAAHCTPDYGIWGRGNKTNTGICELNASSVGMAKAALEAIDGLDLFNNSTNGVSSSVIIVMPDEKYKFQLVLDAILPRESKSKETDAALLTVVGYPAFAISSASKAVVTLGQVVEKLGGRYGFKRFLRDGYRSLIEDRNREYYDKSELKAFEHIECEWPLFHCYMLINAMFAKNTNLADRYAQSLTQDLVCSVSGVTEDGRLFLPEVYVVPHDSIQAEIVDPGSQVRVASGRLPFMWADAMHIIGQLLHRGYIEPADIDPLNRRHLMPASAFSFHSPDEAVMDQTSIMMPSYKMPSLDISKPSATASNTGLTVQIVLLAKDNEVSQILSSQGIQLSTVKCCLAETGVKVFPPSALTRLMSYLGRNERLKLSGQPLGSHGDLAGFLSTASMYSIARHDVQSSKDGRQVIAFTPSLMKVATSDYTVADAALMVETLSYRLNHLSSVWQSIVTRNGRDSSSLKLPTVTIVLEAKHLDSSDLTLNMIRQLMAGYMNETRVKVGSFSDFMDSAFIRPLSFLDPIHCHQTDAFGGQIVEYLSNVNPTQSRLGRRLSLMSSRSLSPSSALTSPAKSTSTLKMTSLLGCIRESRRKSVMSDKISLEGDAISAIGPVEGIDETDCKNAMDHLAVMTATDVYRVSSSQRLSDSNVDIGEAVQAIQECSTLEEKADILHNLAVSHGLDLTIVWPLNKQDEEFVNSDDILMVTVRELIQALYKDALSVKSWSLIRHAAGLLSYHILSLQTAVNDLLVLQKEITVGFPPDNERRVTEDLTLNTAQELRLFIADAHHSQPSFALICQEILVNLGQFLVTNPGLFHDMMRLRIGLIILVMISELGMSLRSPSSTTDDRVGEAVEMFVNLSPYSVRQLLFHVLAGNDIHVHRVDTESGDVGLISITGILNEPIGRKSSRLSVGLHLNSSQTTGGHQRWRSALRRLSAMRLNSASGTTDIDSKLTPLAHESEDDSCLGSWMRKRRMDGSLNRVPPGFYPSVWTILDLVGSKGYIDIAGEHLTHTITYEMTRGELQFAQTVETALDKVQQPEYRQLIIEALAVVGLIAREHGLAEGCVVESDLIVHVANLLFLTSKMKANCCTSILKSDDHCNDSQVIVGVARERLRTPRARSLCSGPGGLCRNFYELAPVGPVGTMSFLVRACICLFSDLHNRSHIECSIA